MTDWCRCQGGREFGSGLLCNWLRAEPSDNLILIYLFKCLLAHITSYVEATYSPPGGKVAPPTITSDHGYTLRLGGVEVKLMHFGNAHTKGGTVVYFSNLKVVAVGDLRVEGLYE